MSQEYIEKNLLQAIDETPLDRGAKIVDVSCGRGVILKALRERGFTNLQGTNHRVYNDTPEEIPITPSVDLIEGLPFDDASFDAVISCEVIEHVRDPVMAIQELTRILRPGGWLFLSTPNLMRLRSRSAFFLTGFHKRKRPFPRHDLPLEELYHTHNFALEFPLLYYYFHACGMRIDRLFPNQIKWLSYLPLAVWYPFVSIATVTNLLFRVSNPSQRQFYRGMIPFLLHPYTLASETIILRAEKVR